MSVPRALAVGVALAIGSIALGPMAHGQEAANVVAPTQPPPGGWVVRGSVRATVFDGGSGVARDGTLLEERCRLALGLARDLSVKANLPIYRSFFDRPAPGQSDFDRRATGLGDLDLTLKLRILQMDLGPVDTIRVSVYGGTEVPTSTAGFGSRSFDPQVGVTAMGIFGRHGLVQNLAWRFTTASAAEPLLPGDTTADVFSFGTAYLYRIAPEEFTVEHRGAWYLTAEAIGTAETNGDVELMLMPGILYEGPRLVLELTVGVPIVQDVRHRPEASFTASIGVRILF
jgi:hypothetical protein